VLPQKITKTTKHYKLKIATLIRVVYVSGYMETQNKSDDACPKTPVIEVYYTARHHFCNKYTDIDAEGFFQRIYPSVQEVKDNWHQVPSFGITDMIEDNIRNSDAFFQEPDQKILHTFFRMMNDYDTNILAGFDNNNQPKWGHLQGWVQDVGTHTSMSVNDVVSINGVFYLCDDIGWQTLAETPLLGKKIGPI